MTIIYLATSGGYDDYRVQAAFTRREDAESFELGDDVEEFELHDGPVDVRTWHQIRWYKRDPLRPGSSLQVPNPYPRDRERRIWDGNPARVEVTHFACGSQVEVEGWDEALVRAKLESLMADTISP